MDAEFTLVPQGDRAVSAVFPDEISEAVNRRVLALCAAIDAARLSGIVNCVPAYHTLLVEYDPLLMTYGQAADLLRNIPFQAGTEAAGRTVRLPVCYGGGFGPDLEEVAAHGGLSPEELVARHAAGAYRVYMLGFRPGVPHLGGLDPRLATPRKATPRLRIEPGSVGIAGEQTGVYPEASPGGWNIIGRTPLKLYQGQSLLRPGDTLRFVPVSREEYEDILAGRTVW